MQNSQKRNPKGYTEGPPPPAPKPKEKQFSEQEVKKLLYKANKDLRLLAEFRLSKWIHDNV